MDPETWATVEEQNAQISKLEERVEELLEKIGRLQANVDDDCSGCRYRWSEEHSRNFCGDCDHLLCGMCTYRCEGCDEDYCDNCITKCEKCETQYCEECLTEDVCDNCQSEDSDSEISK